MNPLNVWLGRRLSCISNFFVGLKYKKFSAGLLDDAGVASVAAAEFCCHVVVNETSRFIEHPSHLTLVSHCPLLGFEDLVHIGQAIYRMLKQGDAAGGARRREVHDVHHGVGEHLTAGVVGTVDPIRDDLAEVTELDAVPDTIRAVTVGRVAYTVGFDELNLRLIPGVAYLGGEAISVSDEGADHDTLRLVEREAVRDVDALALLGEVFLVGLRRFRRARVGLRLDAVARRVELHVVQDLVIQTIVALGVAALLDHDVAITGSEVSARVHVGARVNDLSPGALRHALPPRAGRIASATVRIGLRLRDAGRSLEQFLRRLRGCLRGGLLLRLRGHS